MGAFKSLMSLIVIAHGLWGPFPAYADMVPPPPPLRELKAPPAGVERWFGEVELAVKRGDLADATGRKLFAARGWRRGTEASELWLRMAKKALHLRPDLTRVRVVADRRAVIVQVTPDDGEPPEFGAYYVVLVRDLGSKEPGAWVATRAGKDYDEMTYVAEYDPVVGKRLRKGEQLD